jgi:hypothetical protein
MGQFGQEQLGLKVIKVKTKELYNKVKDNSIDHEDEFETAWQGFLLDSRLKLDEAIKSLDAGNDPEKYITFDAPENHIEDYITILHMLEMCVEPVIEITYEQFQRYARDMWPWTENFKNLSAVYNERI